MSCKQHVFDAQSVDYALASVRLFQKNAATDINTTIAGTSASPQNQGFRFWNISPDAGQGMVYLSSPDGYVAWAVETAWRDKTQTFYYRTGPANGVYVPVYYGCTIYAQLVAVPADQVRQWNGIPIASTTPKPEAHAFFYKGMTEQPDYDYSIMYTGTAPSDTTADVDASLSGNLYPVGNGCVCNITCSEGQLVFSSGPEWHRGSANTWRKFSGGIYAGGWSSLQFEFYGSDTGSLIMGWSNRLLATN